MDRLPGEGGAQRQIQGLFFLPVPDFHIVGQPGGHGRIDASGEADHEGIAARGGQRVVFGQRLMQAASDIFLGWHQSRLTESQYYWRQLKDMKGSVDAATLDEAGLGTYLAVCSLCLARAHARTGDPAAIAGYLGKSKAFDKAIGKFAEAYADQAEKDYQALVEAVDSGQIIAQTGV